MSQMTVTQMSITQIPAYWIGRIGAGPAAVREIGSAGVRSGSTARISVLQQQWPVHPNELTLALRAKTSGSCQERSLAA
jgi:hypothetical protein